MPLQAPDYSPDLRLRDPYVFGYRPDLDYFHKTKAKVRRTLGQKAIPRPGQTRHIDYSFFNDGNMHTLRAGGIPFAWFRISMGIAGKDLEGLAQAIAFLDAGGYPLLYHLLTDFDGSEQADHFLQTAAPLLSRLGNRGMVAQDQETPMPSNDLRRARSESFSATVRQATSLLTALYTSPSLAKAWGLNQPWFRDAFDAGWQAEWNASEPEQLAYWYNYTHPTEKKRCFRQSGIYDNYWWEDPVVGITSDIDIDWYYGTPADLFALIGTNPPAPPPPPPSLPTLPALAKVIAPDGLKMRSTPTTAYGDTNKVDLLPTGEIVTVYALINKSLDEVWADAQRTSANVPTASKDRVGWLAWEHPTLPGSGLAWV